MSYQGLYGQITHIDLASTDAAATRDWCAEVLGWTFQPPFTALVRTPGGVLIGFSGPTD